MLAVPFHDPDGASAPRAARRSAGAVRARSATTRRSRPGSASSAASSFDAARRRRDDLRDALQTTLAYILINRDGPAIQPGSRNYARSWIRDGALTSDGAARDRATPRRCATSCAGTRATSSRRQASRAASTAAAPIRVPENDSNGEFIYAVAEYYRFTRDVGFVYELWPRVVRAVDYIAALRAAAHDRRRITTPDKQVVLRPAARVDQPRGLLGAPGALVLGRLLRAARPEGRGRARARGRRRRSTPRASPRCATRSATTCTRRSTRTMAQHSIDYLPGSVELGDFDPTSTAIALTPAASSTNLPRGALAAHLRRATSSTSRSAAARTPGEDGYTPYELRNVGALIRLGRRERALALLELLLADQRPPAWNQWAEVVWRDPAPPRFIGDMPHTWVGVELPALGAHHVRLRARGRRRAGARRRPAARMGARRTRAPASSACRRTTACSTTAVRRDGDQRAAASSCPAISRCRPAASCSSRRCRSRWWRSR